MLYFDVDTDFINISKLYAEHIKLKKGLSSKKYILSTFGIDDALYSFLIREREMNEFKYKNLWEIKNMSLDEVIEYYKLLRQYEFEHNISISKGMKTRELIHSLCLGSIQLDGVKKRRKIHIINDNSHVSDKPVIYISNHIGRFDVEVCFQSIKKHAYLFLGDPGDLYKSLAGLLLYANGIIVLETDDKIDRFIAKERAIELLKAGKSLLLYPEGAWNLSMNQIIMPLYAGAVEIAIKCEVEIVPMAIEQKDTEFYVNIGENLNLSGIKLEQRFEYTEKIRNILANLRWDLWNLFKIEKRKNNLQSYEEYVNAIMSESEFLYTADDAFNSYFTSYASPDKVFSFMKKIQPNKNNAFLLRGNCKK